MKPITIASMSDNLTYAKEMFVAGCTPAETYDFLLKNKYIVDGIRYHGRTVQTALTTMYAIDSALLAGRVKGTKVRGLRF